MNKLTNIALQYNVRLFALIIGILCTSGLAASNVSDLTIENRIATLPTSIEVKYSSEVRKRIKQYTVDQRKTSEILLGKVSIYFPTFENIFKEKGIPEDLKYLSVIESGLRPGATSRSGAAGLWQFMRPTGRMLGLKITRTIDERRDVELSTEAAADYLLHLYERFDDWTLAIAAYNCGPGNLRKAIRKSGGKTSYWDIQKYLPRETREYVPKFIAMTYVMNYYYEHDLIPELPQYHLTETTKARVFEEINLKRLSKELDMEHDILKTLNPKYIRNYIPSTKNGNHYITLPTKSMITVAEKYNVEPEFKLEKIEEEIVPEPRSLVEIPSLTPRENLYAGNNSHAVLVSLKSLDATRRGQENEEFNMNPEPHKTERKRSLFHVVGRLFKKTL